MVMPSGVSEGAPLVLLDDGGIWRDAGTPGVTEPQSLLRQRVEQYLSGVMKKVSGNPPQQILPNHIGFQAFFADIGQKILPAAVREALANADAAAPHTGPRPQLDIFFHAGVEWIPWELLRLSSGFLGTRFAVARLPVMNQATELRPPRDRQVRKVYNLLAKDVLDASVEAEWATTFNAYNGSAGWESRFPANGAANYPTLDELDQAQQAEIIHVTCHGGVRDNPGDEYFWTLDHRSAQTFDYRITPTTARNISFKARPLVFGNACASAAGAEVGTSAEFAALQGFGASFLIGGALNFVGTFAPITKTMAVAFAKRFYAKLLGTHAAQGLPVAEALRATKQSFTDEDCADPSFLFYSLYGPSDSTYRPQ